MRGAKREVVPKSGHVDVSRDGLAAMYESAASRRQTVQFVVLVAHTQHNKNASTNVRHTSGSSDQVRKSDGSFGPLDLVVAVVVFLRVSRSV